MIETIDVRLTKPREGSPEFVIYTAEIIIRIGTECIFKIKDIQVVKDRFNENDIYLRWPTHKDEVGHYGVAYPASKQANNLIREVVKKRLVKE